MSDIQLFNENCFDVFPTLEDKSINLFVLDLPYGQTACKWDSVIDLEQMWKDVKRIMKPNAILVFFCTTKFGYTLIKSNEKWFKYQLIWKKSRKVGFLSANKKPLVQHENIYVFNDKPVTHSKKENQEYSTYNPQKTEGKPFKVKGGKSKAVNGNLSRGHEVISKEYENKGDRHPTSIIDHENMYVFKKEQGTYNPQKTKGKAYNKTNTGNNNKDSSAYGIIDRSSHLEGEGNRVINKGDRHPTSIIDHENIYVFNGNNDENKDLMNYSKKVLKHIGKTKTTIKKEIPMADHFFRYSKNNFSLPTKETYEELIELYNIDEMKEFIPFNELEEKGTYNPQKTEGKPYKCKQGQQTNLYGIEEKEKVITDNKGDRHPTSIINEIPEYEGDSILVYKNPHKTIHRTQKPVELLEWLIKTYSNEGDTVIDFTMGSGTAGIACMNTKRKFIGVEMDKEIFKLAEDRIEKHK